MEKKIERVSPKCLYPVVTIESLDPTVLQNVIVSMKRGELPAPINVIIYDGYYFILEGNYEMLAANILKWPSVEIEIIERSKINFWKSDRNIEEQLVSVGMNAVYDFEGIGDFKYKVYPPYYKRGE